MTCRDFADFLLDYVEGDAARRHAPALRRAHGHLPRLRAYLQHYTETIKAGRLAMADDLPADVPDDLVSAILKARNH